MLASRSKFLAVPDFQNRIRGSGSPFRTFAELRGLVHPGSISTAVRWLRTMPGIFSSRFPHNTAALCRDPSLSPIQLDNEISWATATCLEHADRVNCFLLGANQLEHLTLKGNYEEAKSTLDHLEGSCGVSLWSIENRFALLQRSGGLEQQKAYAQDIFKVRGRFDLVAFLAFYLSQRNEESTTPLHFFDRLRAHFAAWDGLDDLKAYLWFHLSGAVAEEPPMVGDILRREATATLVDYYDTFVRLGSYAISHRAGSAESFAGAFDKLVTKINDTRISKALFLWSGLQKYITNIPVRFLEIPDAMVAGNVDDASWCAAECLSETPGDVSNWLSCSILRRTPDSISQDGVERRSIAGEAIAAFQSIVHGGIDISSAALALESVSLNFRLMRFTAGVSAISVIETSSEPEIPDYLAGRAFIDCPYLDVMAIPRYVETQYLSYLRERYPSSITVALESVARGQELAIPTSVHPAFMGEALLRGAYHKADYEKTLEMASGIDQRCTPRLRRNAHRLAAHSLLSLERLPDAVEYIAKAGVQEPEAIRVLPIELCAAMLNKNARRELAGMVGTPIVLDFYSRLGHESLNNVRAYAYEDFLAAYGVDKPSRLGDRLSSFDCAELVYYLRYICVRDNMQMSVAFDGTRDLENERIAVCEMLTNLDPENADAYNDEIREILLSQTIASGVRHAEQSKIYVDAYAALRWSERNLKENYLRLQALMQAGLAESQLTSDEVQQIDWENEEAQPLAVPNDEPSAIAFGLLRSLFRELAVNPQFGLDCYLSMRIRHGTLSGQLRSALVDRHVITQRLSESGEYQKNEYWLQKLDLPSEIAEAIDKRLAEFSRQCDAFIQHIAQDLIQIKSVGKPLGLFNFSDPKLVLSAAMNMLGGIVEPGATFEEFITTVLNVFWRIVDRQLKTTREHIDRVLKPQQTALFVHLEQDLIVLAPGAGISDLHWAIKTAQTESQRNLDQVKDWFRLAKPEVESAFTLDQLMDIGLAIVKKIFRDFEPLITKEVPDTIPAVRGLLTYLSDVLFIVFDNIRRHSGLMSPPVLIKAECDDAFIRIRVQNRCSETARTHAAEAKVADIKRLIRTERYQREVATEGGTGLIKIRKIIGPQQQPECFDFGFTGDDCFFVSVQFPYQAV